MVHIKHVMRALEMWAPRASQQSYDNVGLQVGDPGVPVSTGVIALDLTPAVVQEAIEHSAQVIITHHPLIFRPLKSVTTNHWNGALITALIQHGIALYCIHTNLDAAYDGVSYALANQLGLKDIRFLRPLPDTLVKLATFVPGPHATAVREALAQAGAGHIGHYEACAFSWEGTGHFKPTEEANPMIGKAGGAIESVEEHRIEVEVQKWNLASVIRALKEAHPYDEVAYDVYPMLNDATRTGMGTIGSLDTPESLEALLSRIRTAINEPALRYVGDLSQQVQRVAVCGGSGADLIGDAMRAGADAYLTADVTYHRFFEVLDTSGNPSMALINAGHYETEQCTENLLVAWLSKRFAEVQWIQTQHRTSPINTFVG